MNTALAVVAVVLVVCGLALAGIDAYQAITGRRVSKRQAGELTGR
jgi:hypothetical protein